MFQIPAWLILSMIFIGLFMSFFYLLTFFETRNRKKENKIKRFPSLTFIVPAYNASSCIKKTIYSILNVDYPRNKVKIFVVNDGSTDNTSELVKELMKKCKRIQLFRKKNEGKAAALNYGIKRVTTELTIVLDADTIIQQDILRKSIGFLSNPDIMAVTARLVPLNKKGFFVKMQAVEYALTSFFRKLLSNINALPIAPAFTIYKTFFFRKHKGFDVDNLTEDFEMALRVHSCGYNIVYVLDSYAETVVPSKFTHLYRQRVRWGYGTLYNLKKYKHLFSLKYGDLGVFLLPTMLLGMSIIILTFLLALYNLILGTNQLIKHIMLGWVPAFSMDLFKMLVTLSDPRIILGIFGLAISLFFLFLIKKEAKININIFYYVVYVVFYIWFLAVFYISSIIRFFSRKPSW